MLKAAFENLRERWRHRTRRHQPEKDIRIAGIYTVCWRLGLPKCGPAEDRNMRALATMKSGAVALYQYHDWEPAGGVDWGWHIFRCLRYAKPQEIATLPWLTKAPSEHFDA